MVKGYPDACGALNGRVVQPNDNPQGMQKQHLLMDRAYSNKKMRIIAVKLGYVRAAQAKLQGTMGL